MPAITGWFDHELASRSSLAPRLSHDQAADRHDHRRAGILGSGETELLRNPYQSKTPSLRLAAHRVTVRCEQ